jgi:predicted esterase
LDSGKSTYVGYQPETYKPETPMSLLVWMHGCGGVAEDDMWDIAPYATRAGQSYIAISLGGRDGDCWDMNTDEPKVLAAITDVKRYFNINPRKIYLGGYSSGGDLTYHVGLRNPGMFAGLLVENSTPFRDSGVAASSVQNLASPIHVAHLAHLSDDTYPIATVRAELATLEARGYLVTQIEKAGTHYDADSPEAAPTKGTAYDLRTYLLPNIDLGWESPAL